MENIRIFRFAPSPTGNMHLGNGRTAILNYYLSLKLKTQNIKTKFFIRIDDTDAERDKEIYEKNIYKDLKWLGISYETIIKQSERISIYENFFEKLKQQKKIYECFETEEELDKDTIYNRKALFLSEEEKEELRKTKKSYWRFFMNFNEYEMIDHIMGKIKTKRTWSDPIIKRQRDEKPFTYNFTSAIDDYLMEVTDIIRGQEHLNNAFIQQEIINCFSSKKINFYHLPVIITPDGQKLSKRLGDLSIKTLREEGFFFSSIISICLSLGTNKSPLITDNINDLVAYLDMKNFSKNSPKFEKKNIEILNKKILQNLSSKTLQELNFNEEIWSIIKYNINYLNDYEKWQKILNYSDIFSEFPYKSLLKEIYDNEKINLNKIPLDLKKEFLLSLHKTLTGIYFGPEITKIFEYKQKKFNIFNKFFNKN